MTATRAGIHDYDTKIDDLSAEGQARNMAPAACCARHADRDRAGRAERHGARRPRGADRQHQGLAARRRDDPILAQGSKPLQPG
ncbi:MAG: hypothetical protein WDN69_31615 [Aliidongia sp.]